MPNFVFSNDAAAGADLVAKSKHDFPGDPSQYTWESSPLDHFVFLYQECCGLAVSDLAIFQQADKALREIEKEPNRIATSYTHRRGKSHFSIETAEAFSQLLRWIEVMGYLSDNAFYLDADGRRCINFTGLDQMNRILHVDETEQVKAHLEEHGGTLLLGIFEQRLKDAGKPAVVERMNNACKGIINTTDRLDRQKFHELILKKVFPG